MKVLMVGTALDTNGQKMRFVEAANRWGSDPDVLKALWVGTIDDLGGVAGRFAAASSEGPLVIRSAHQATAYFDFPTDIIWSKRRNQAEVQKLAEEADVIHLTNDVKAYIDLRLPRLRKPAVLHHHGTLFRNNPARLLAEAKRFHMVQTVSTIDLMRPAPDILRWLPTAYDMDMLARVREEYRRPEDGLVRIVSAPTNRAIKSTDALEQAVRELQAEGLPVELVLVEGKTWEQCLKVKATADIYFDQVKLGYGCNAVEAWGMGIPVVAGADDWTLNRMKQEWNTEILPFYEATEQTIADRLRELVQSSYLRAAVADRGSAFAYQYHAEKPALARAMELYVEAIKVRARSDEEVAPIPLTPGRFRTDGRRSLQLRLGSRSVQFTNGEATVTDPELAQRLRRLIAFDGRHQITEVYEDVA